MAKEPEENYNTGFISIYRSILKHWLFPKNKPLTNFEAWVTILLEVNYSNQKVNIGYKVFECKRGESLNSLDTWARLFNWNKSKVRRFFKMLQNDSMIVLNNEQKTTRLTVCKYEDYQGVRNESETKVKRKRNASETQVTPNNKDNKDNNILISQNEFKLEVKQFTNKYDKKLLQEFYLYWSEPTRDKTKMRKDLEKTWDTNRRLSTWFNRSKK